jgi:hypothetical protein
MLICGKFAISADYILFGSSNDDSHISSGALRLASRFDALDEDGRALVRAALIGAEDRMAAKATRNETQERG